MARKLRKSGPKPTTRPTPHTFQVPRAQLEQQTKAMGGLDGLLHGMVVQLASFNGGAPPPYIVRWRERIRAGARVRILFEVEGEPPIVAAIT